MFLGERPVPGPGDEAWTDDDITAALEWQSWQAQLCAGCGHPRDESMSHEDHGPTYTAEALRCRACEAKDIARREWVDAEGSTDGLYFAALPEP